MQSFPGIVKAKIVEIRFASAGRVSWIGVKIGDKVKKGQVLAKLETVILAKEHQKELADYEKVRAGFDSLKSDDKYVKDRAQADLNAAVLNVELADYQLKSAVLTAPESGIIADDGNIIAGMNITPASFTLKLVIDNSIYISGRVSQKEIGKLKQDQQVIFRPQAFASEKYPGKISLISPLPPNNRSTDFEIRVALEKFDGLLIGLTGKLYQ